MKSLYKIQLFIVLCFVLFTQAVSAKETYMLSHLGLDKYVEIVKE